MVVPVNVSTIRFRRLYGSVLAMSVLCSELCLALGNGRVFAWALRWLIACVLCVKERVFALEENKDGIMRRGSLPRPEKAVLDHALVRALVCVVCHALESSGGS